MARATASGSRLNIINVVTLGKNSGTDSFQSLEPVTQTPRLCILPLVYLFLTLSHIRINIAVQLVSCSLFLFYLGVDN
jgi:hypothetical protein